MENNKIKVIIPRGVRFLQDWKEFRIPDYPCIIDKQLTGCGFTELCLGNDENVVLCSPRKVLIDNKVKQHNVEKKYPTEVYYAENKYEKETKSDTKLGSKQRAQETQDVEIPQEEIKKEEVNIMQGIENYFYYCYNKRIPCKILVTYDSFKYVRTVLESIGQINNFRVVADEFQAIVQDAKFKSSTEIKFLDYLRGLTKLCFVSATPILGAYLQMLPEFRDLPYFEFDWEQEDKNRVIEPAIEPFFCPRGIIQPACNIVREYKAGKFRSTVINLNGELREVVSREAVFYVNCVNNICDIVSKTGLTLDECNIICANSDENEKKLRKAFNVKKDVPVFGTPPLEGEPHKMFTFCTRTAYIGADFYSTNARNFIFSDANIDCLTVDIQIDLPQILGRQRLECNPWRNKAELYFRLVAKKESAEHGEEILQSKEKATLKLLELYFAADPEGKRELIKKFKKDYSNYKDDYVAINRDENGNETLVFNNLVKVNDRMGYDLLQKNYKNLFKLINSLKGVEHRDEVSRILDEAEKIQHFHKKLKFLYDLNMPEDVARIVLNNIGDTDYSKYYWTISPSRAGTLNYQRGNLEAEYNAMKGIADVRTIIYESFSVKQKYTKSYAKSLIQEIYNSLGITRTAKASDLESYFEIKSCLVPNPETGRRDAGFEIIKKKD